MTKPKKTKSKSRKKVAKQKPPFKMELTPVEKSVAWTFTPVVMFAALLIIGGITWAFFPIGNEVSDPSSSKTSFVKPSVLKFHHGRHCAADAETKRLNQQELDRIGK